MGYKDYHFFDHKIKYYWERRSPVNPDSPERFLAEHVEENFRPDFEVMASKNNHHRPKGEREFFDRPIEYTKQGFGFTPHHKRPIYLLNDGKNLDDMASM